MDSTEIINRLRSVLSNSEHANPKLAVQSAPRFVPRRTIAERCDLCGAEIRAVHQHLVEPENHKLICACDACAVLFSNQARLKYRRVPRRIRYLSEFRLDDTDWAGFMLPINLAFFLKRSSTDKILAFYPSPAGPTESLLDIDSWSELVRENPVLDEMEADVEALLINRLGTSREHYLVPVDECYALTGLIRRHWHGFTGGAEVWTEIGRFFARLKQQSATIKGESHA